MDINLVAHVPDDLVVRGIKEPVERDREFDDAEVGREVPATTDAIYCLNEEVPDLSRQLLELVIRKAAEISWASNTVQEFGQPGFLHCQ